MNSENGKPRWLTVLELIQLDTVIAIVAGLACWAGAISGGTLASILTGLVAASRIPRAIQAGRTQPRDDDNDPPTTPPTASSKGGMVAKVLATSAVLTLLLGLLEWRDVLRRGNP